MEAGEASARAESALSCAEIPVVVPIIEKITRKEAWCHLSYGYDVLGKRSERTVFIIDCDSVCCSVEFLVFCYHHGNFEFLQSLSRERTTNVSAMMR